MQTFKWICVNGGVKPKNIKNIKYILVRERRKSSPDYMKHFKAIKCTKY
jgi:hypothetical protein